jgi:hypothetical protein
LRQGYHQVDGRVRDLCHPQPVTRLVALQTRFKAQSTSLPFQMIPELRLQLGYPRLDLVPQDLRHPLRVTLRVALQLCA